MRRMTGLLLLTATCASEQEINKWQQQAAQIPYTVLAFRSVNRRQLQVVVRVAFADGHEAQSADEYLSLLRQSQQQASAIYQSLAGCE